MTKKNSKRTGGNQAAKPQPATTRLTVELPQCEARHFLNLAEDCHINPDYLAKMLLCACIEMFLEEGFSFHMPLMPRQVNPCD